MDELMNLPVLTFSEAIEKSNSLGDSSHRYLLLGNGFSIGLFPNIFSYKSLLDEADFLESEILKKVFEKLNTSDFELVIKGLKDSAKIVLPYTNNLELSEKLNHDGEALKKILVSTISKKHPAKISEVEEIRFKQCRKFLKYFGKIYSLNYDLLLYWTLLSKADGDPINIDDGFRNPDHEYGQDYRVFDSPHSPTFWYLHGGLHLFDAGSRTRKNVWADTGKPLMDQVREALDKDLFPLFVAEGASEEKLTKINHNGYLSKALRSFESICNLKGSQLFMYGHSLAVNDNHILDFIRKGKISKIFVGLYRKSSEYGYDQNVISVAENLKNERNSKNPLEVIFFDSQSACVWNEKE